MMRWRLSPEEPHNPGKTYLSLHHLTTDQNLIFYLKVSLPTHSIFFYFFVCVAVAPTREGFDWR